MLKILSLLFSLSFLTTLSAQDLDLHLTQPENEEEVLHVDLSNENESQQEFKELVQNTIQLMGPEVKTDTAHSLTGTNKALKN
jgi:hypothetical protein